MVRKYRGHQAIVSWLPCVNFHIPRNAIKAAEGVYICRVEQDGETLPGMVIPQVGRGWVVNDGIVYEHSMYEILCDSRLPSLKASYVWEEHNGGRISPDAVVAGTNQKGKPFYIARAIINGEMVVGKAKKNKAFFPVKGLEHIIKKRFHILVIKE